MTFVLTDSNSIASNYIYELRDTSTQNNRRQFERNIERLGTIAGYEASKLLSYKPVTAHTPLANVDVPISQEPIVLATVLRAGLPLQRGIQQIFDSAELAYIAAGRKPETAAGVEIDLSYVATPDISDKVLIIADTMLATGQSFVDAHRALLEYGKPSRTIIVSVIASQPGLDYIAQHIPEADIITAAVDPSLNDQFFIVPGLGDAGDLLYGPKASKI